VVVFILLSLIMQLMSCRSEGQNNYIGLIDNGEFAKAQEVIERILIEDTSLSDEQRFDLSFEIERMRRIRKDFTKNEAEVLEFIKKYIPDVTREDLRKWENDKSLEYKVIDGEKKYFNRAARNLFRVNKECLQIWKSYHEERNIDLTIEQMDYKTHNGKIIRQVLKTGNKYVFPVRMRITYTISVIASAVPEGKTIRCWIPFPREIPERQTDIRLLTSEPAVHKIADNMTLQRTVYMEKESVGEHETVFSISYEYTSYGTYVPIDPEKVVSVKSHGDLQEYLKEEPPHIVFTEDFRKLSKKILGEETNPYRKAQILFKWVNDNTPWASAREYSSIRSLSQYGYKNKHGDCGIQSMLFITLCRLNGIPARWQSGWDFKPPYDTMHDWGMIYFEPYGWMPMDAYYGPHETDDEDLKWFYLSGMDSYRLIFNDDYSKSFFPDKMHHRSETLDSQRGEVEWEGSNLYFDQWNWNMDGEVLSQFE
jgi:hypothetical protein